MHSLNASEEQENSSTIPGSEDNLANDIRGHHLGMADPYASEELQTSPLQKIAYDSDFTEDINMKMQMPSRLTVASRESDEDFLKQNGDILSRMEVPDRIVVSVGDGGVKYGGAQHLSGPLYAEEYLGGGSSVEPLSLTTPPRKLTLAERNLDVLDIAESKDTEAQEIKTEIRSSRFLQAFHDKQKRHLPTSTTDCVGTRTSVVIAKAGSDAPNSIIGDIQQHDSSEELDDISLIRRQMFKLHRRITAMEKYQAEQAKRDVYIYAVTIGFCVLSGWFLYSFRKPY